MENTNKEYTIIVSDQATRMLVSHSRFLAEVSEQAAMNLLNEFEEKANSIKFMPERNPRLEDAYLPTIKYYKLLMGKWYILIYKIEKDKIFIEYVVDCKQNYQWLL